MASAEYEAKRSDNSTVAIWAVHLSFPSYKEIPAKDFYWSTTNGVELLDFQGNPQQFTRALVETPRGRHQRDRGNDYAEFKVVNPNNATYQDIYPREHLMERAVVRIYECYEIYKGYFEKEQRFHGYLKDFNLGESEKSLDMTCLSDMSRTGFLVGGRILTRERCGTEFNFNGTNTAQYHICGWQTIQGGDPDYCSKYLDRQNGCESHNNSHRFFAVPGLSNIDINIVFGIFGTGFDHNSGGCFSEDVWVLTPDMTCKRISEIEYHDSVMGFDIFDEDSLTSTSVLNTEQKVVDNLCEALFHHQDSVEFLPVTDEHLFYIGNHKYTPLKGIDNGDLFRPVKGLTDGLARIDINLIDYSPIVGENVVYNFQTGTGNYIVTNEKQETFWKVHNSKSITPIEL